MLRLKFYLEANGVIEGSKKKSIQRIGSTSEAIEYDDLVKKVQEFYDPKLSVIVQRFRFNTREWAASESIAAYVAALHWLAECCDFSETLNVLIRDRLVCGVKHKLTSLLRRS